MVAVGPPSTWFPAGDGGAPFVVEVVAPPRPAPPAATLRVVTFNVEYSTRTAPLAAALRGHEALARADVVLLQEIGPHAVDGARAGAVADALGLGYACAHDLAILCRWPLRDVHVMELPHARLPYNRRRRLALSAMIDHAAGPLRVIDVHLDTRVNIDERIRQLAPAVEAAPDAHVIGGDVNTLPFRFAGGAVPIGRTDQAAALDAYMGTHGFANPVGAAGHTHRHFLKVRLDALFTRGVTPGRAHVARDVRVSDHFPVWTDLIVAAR